MKKTLVALTIALSSCISQPHKCPGDDEMLKAGLRIYSASEMLESDKEVDHRLARTMYGATSEYYFACGNGDKKHIERHYIEARERVLNYLGLTNDQRKRTSLNIQRIQEEIDLSSYTKR